MCLFEGNRTAQMQVRQLVNPKGRAMPAAQLQTHKASKYNRHLTDLNILVAFVHNFLSITELDFCVGLVHILV